MKCGLCRYCGEPIRTLKNADDIWAHTIDGGDIKRSCGSSNMPNMTNKKARPVPEGSLLVGDETQIEEMVTTTLAGNTLVMQVAGSLLLGYSDVPKGSLAVIEEVLQ